MSAPSDAGGEAAAGWLYDGRSATHHEVSVRIEDGALRIDDEPPVAIGLLTRSDLGRAVFGRRDLPGWRLGFDHGLPPGLEQAAPRPQRYGGWIDRIGLWRAAFAGLLLSTLAVIGAVYGIDVLARMIPFAWEQKLGDAITGDFTSAACIGPDGQRALDTLAHRLSPADKPMRVRVIDVPVVNAVALPGGQILIFSRLIDEAKSPDEVAGVLAHEIGHVERGHVMIALLRRFGLGLLLNSGGQPGAYAQTLLDASYSRSAEAEADTYSIDHLLAAHISPAPTAAFFARLGRAESAQPALFAYFASHPPSAEREQRFASRARGLRDPRPALNPAEWQAVRAICTMRLEAKPKQATGFRF